tara:strand:+ start:135 stop:356 length:222 start_codon:yes stop_codon:yes gene_type:complete
MEHIIKHFETLNLQSLQSIAVSDMQNTAPTHTNMTTNQLFYILVQENNFLKMEIKRLHSLLVVPKARIPNWVR